MASYTIRDFTEVVGLGKDRDSVIRSGIILKALCGLGIAKETGTRKQGNGRPAAVYEVPDPIVLPIGLGQKVLEERKIKAVAVQEAVVETQEVATPVPVVSGFYFDDDEDED
jgi:hypothetical protein